MPVALSESVLGPEPEEVVQGRRLQQERQVKLLREESLSEARRLLVARAGEVECEAILDVDGGFSRAKCGCLHFRRFGLRAGPCRHLLALRLSVLRDASGFGMGLPGPAGRVVQ
jgi:hypothetical protein